MNIMIAHWIQLLFPTGVTACRRRRHRARIVVTVESCEVRSLLSGTATIIQDLNQGIRLPAFADPSGYVETDDWVWFSATTNQTGRALWRTDGTAEGTQLMTEPLRGTGAINPSAIAAVGSDLYLVNSHISERQSLWRVQEDTLESTELSLPASLDYPTTLTGPLTQFHGRIYLTLQERRATGIHHFVYSVGPGENSLTPVSAEPLGSQRYGYGGAVQYQIVGDKLFLLHSDDSGARLMAISVSGAATILPAIPGMLSSDGDQAVILSTAPASRFPPEVNHLLVSDGTLAGTGELSLPPAFNSGEIEQRSVASGGGFVWFAIRNQSDSTLWRSDGTVAGTEFVDTIDFGYASSATFANGQYFLLTESYSIAGGQLWVSDGTADGTQELVRVLTIVSQSGGLLLPVDDGIVVIGVVNGPLSSVAWHADGTPNGVRSILSFDDTQRGVVTSGFVTDNGLFLGVADRNDRPHSLWYSEGTLFAAGPILIEATDDSHPRAVFVDRLRQRALFGASTDSSQGSNSTLWQTEGPGGRTMQIERTEGYPLGPWRLEFRDAYEQAKNGRVFLWGNVDSYSELWSIDPTDDHMRLVAQFDRADDYGLNRQIEVSGNRVFFTPASFLQGTELWVSDGTPAGTRLVMEFTSGNESTRFVRIESLDDERVIVSLVNSAGRLEFWVSDGTPNGTALLKSFVVEDPFRRDLAMEQIGDRVFFFANDGLSGTEPWTTDGTIAGTRRLVDIAAGPTSSMPERLENAGSRLYFAARNTAGQLAWWATDGTTAGTRYVMPADLESQFRRELRDAVSGRIYVVRDQPTRSELLVAEGSAPRILLSLDHQVERFEGHDFFSAYGFLFFSTIHESAGRRLWYTNGDWIRQLPADLANIIPEALPYYVPRHWTPLRGGLFFGGWTQSTGLEPAFLTIDEVIGVPDSLQLFMDGSGDFISFDPVLGAASYEVEITDLTVSLASVWIIPAVGSLVRLPIELHHRHLGIRVRGVARLGTSGRWSAANELVTASEPIVLPIDTLPAMASASIRWLTPSGFTSYEVQVNNLDSRSIVLHRTGLAPEAQPLSSGPLEPAMYAVWVRGLREDGRMSEWSAAVTFTVLTDPVAIEQLSTDETAGRVDLTWTRVDGASEYEIEMYRGTVDPENRVFTTRQLVTTTFFILGPGEYSVRVRTRQSGRVASDWSDAVRFRIRQAPAIRVDGRTVSWTAVPSAQAYDLRITHAVSGTVVVWQSVSNTSYPISNQLAPGLYQVEVRSKYADGSVSRWAAVSTESFAPPVEILSGTGSTVDATPLITWRAIPNAEQYEIVLSRHPSGTEVLRTRTGLTTNFRVPTPLANGAYTIWVRAHFAQGGRSLWSSGSTLAIGQSPPLVATPGLLSWIAVARATRYELWVNRIDPATGRHTAVVRDAFVIDTRWSTAGLGSGIYRAWLRAIRDEAGTSYRSDWSPAADFRIPR